MTFESTKKIDIENISILLIFNILFKQKLFIFLCTALFAVLSVFYSLSLSNYFQSSSLVKVISSENNQNYSSLLSQYSGLAGSMGLDIGSSSSVNQADMIIEQIKSKDFTKHLMQFESVTSNIFAGEGFDFSTQKIIFDETLYKNDKWVRETNKSSKVPTHIEVNQKLLGEILSISKDTKSGLVRISITHPSPIFAQSLLNLIIKEINAINSAKDKLNARSAIEYLENTRSKSKISSIQYAINNLIEMQVKTLMLVDIKNYYSIEPIDSPYIPEVKAGPSRSLICITLTILGFILSCLISISLFFYKKIK